jgi:peptidoglycan/LPS O-acetylase OafA/YrhL
MNRSLMLDILRGLAILLVVGRHYEYQGFAYKIGWCGVDLFFVLSGFLISGLLFKEYKRRGSVDLKRFWIRRGFKIYPAFYGLLVFVIVDYAALGALTRHIFSDLFFLQDYLHPIAEHGWSLGVEEKFYFVLPVLLLVLIRVQKNSSDPFKPLPYLFAAIFAGCLALRVHAVLGGKLWYEVQQPAHLRMDSLFAGVTLGYFQGFKSTEFRRAGNFPLWILSLALLLPIALFDLQTPLMLTLGLSTTLSGFAILLLWLVNQAHANWRFLSSIAWIGRYSYSIYLWNWVIRSKFGYPEAGWGLASLPIYVALTIGVGWLMAYLVETPFLALRERYFPARR